MQYTLPCLHAVVEVHVRNKKWRYRCKYIHKRLRITHCLRIRGGSKNVQIKTGLVRWFRHSCCRRRRRMFTFVGVFMVFCVTFCDGSKHVSLLFYNKSVLLESRQLAKLMIESAVKEMIIFSSAVLGNRY